MNWRIGAAFLGLMATTSSPALAADHRDGTSVLQDPSTDINDVYTWTSADASKVYVVMTVFPAATTASTFSTGAWYVLHTFSRPAVLDPAGTVPLDIICGFNAAKKITCYVGSDPKDWIVSADASATSGVSSSSSKVKVFAGLRDDPFFFNLDGFNRVRGIVKTAAATLTFDNDTNKCPTLNVATADTLVNGLKQNKDGMTPPVNFFAGLNTLSIVMELDKALVTKGGAIFSVYGATHKR